MKFRCVNEAALSAVVLISGMSAALLSSCPKALAGGAYPEAVPGFPVQSFAGEQDRRLDDVIDWCTTWIGDLQSARAQANLEAATGGLHEATEILLRALRQKSSQALARSFPVPALPPHTVEAIRTGLRLAEDVVEASRSSRLDQLTRTQVGYIAVDGVFGVIEQAYYDLDVRYYREAIRSCIDPWTGCLEQARSLPRNYFDGLRRLANRFLDLQKEVSPLQADDRIELTSILATSRGAREILMRSVYQRELSCAIRRLVSVESYVQSSLRGSTRVPRRDQVLMARSGIVGARSLLEQFCNSPDAQCGCER